MEITTTKDTTKKKPFSYGNLTIAVGAAMWCTAMAVLLLLLFPYFEERYDFDAPRGNPEHWIQAKEIPIEWMSPAEVASSLQTISFEFNQSLLKTGAWTSFWLLIWAMVGVYFLSALVTLLVRNHWTYPLEALEKVLIGLSLAFLPAFGFTYPSDYLPLISLVVFFGALAWRRILLFPLLMGLITWEVASSAGISLESYLGDYRPVFENPLVLILLSYLIFFSLLTVAKLAALNFWPSEEEKDQRGFGPFLAQVLDDLKDSGGSWITLFFWVLTPVLVLQWLNLEYPIGRWDFIFAFPWKNPAELALLFEMWGAYILGFIGRSGYQFGMIYLAHCIGFVFLFRYLAQYLRKPLWGKEVQMAENFLALLFFFCLPALLPKMGCDPSHLPVLYLVACLALIFRPLLIVGTSLFFLGWMVSYLGFGNLPALYKHWKPVMETDLFWVGFNCALGFTLLYFARLALSWLWSWYGKNLGRTLVEEAGRMVRGRNYEGAIDNLDRAMVCYPGYGEAFKLRGEICEFQRDYTGALPYFEQGLEAARREKLGELIDSLSKKVEDLKKVLEDTGGAVQGPSGGQAVSPGGEQPSFVARQQVKSSLSSSAEEKPSAFGVTSAQEAFAFPPTQNLSVHKSSQGSVVLRISHRAKNLGPELKENFSQLFPSKREQEPGMEKSSGGAWLACLGGFILLIYFGWLLVLLGIFFGVALGLPYLFLSNYLIEIALSPDNIKIKRSIFIFPILQEIPTAQLVVTPSEKFWGRAISLTDKSKPGGLAVTLGFGLSKKEKEWLLQGFQKFVGE